MVRNKIRRTSSFFLNRLLAGIWIPMLVAIVLAVLLAAGLGMADAAGLSAFVASLGGPFAFSSVAANEILEVLIGIQVAVLTLYFSITLLVLTLATQSLGVRLLERWIARIEMRASLAQWAALVAYSLVLALLVDPAAPDAEVPRATVLVGIVLTLAALGWLGFAYHRLARTAHIDTSIVQIGRDFGTDRQDWRLVDGPDPDATPDRILRAARSGYLNGFDRQKLIDAAERAGGRIAMRVEDGGFVVEGDALAHFWGGDDAMDEACRRLCGVEDYRADRSTGPFAVALLVEVASRALSPAVNDFQTAASCADWIGHGLSMRLAHEIGNRGWFAGDESGVARLHVGRTGVLSQAMPHLAVLHRFIRPHPYVAARLIEGYGAALRRATDPADRQRLYTLIEDASRPCDTDRHGPLEYEAVEKAVERARGTPETPRRVA